MPRPASPCSPPALHTKGLPAPAEATSLNQRIRADISALIGSGEWPPGHRIPSEHALMAEYGCSRMTVNKALSALAQAGTIERRKRAGSFVSRPHPHLEQAALEIPDIAQAIAARGMRYEYTLLARHMDADQATASHVPMPAVEKPLYLQGLHLADGAPFALEQRSISSRNVAEAQDIDFSTHAPGNWLLQHVPWTRAEHRIRAINADRATAKLLQVSTGTACLVLERRTWRGERPVTVVVQTFLGDDFDLVARFSAGAAPR